MNILEIISTVLGFFQKQNKNTYEEQPQKIDNDASIFQLPNYEQNAHIEKQIKTKNPEQKQSEQQSILNSINFEELIKLVSQILELFKTTKQEEATQKKEVKTSHISSLHKIED